ncbi:MAG: hypothetical protein Q7P63_14320 [Verrucomicrobiota bacterium JB022]|nr:hypothetical protein [Verrucomicrobiota bacterium JB022]
MSLRWLSLFALLGLSLTGCETVPGGGNPPTAEMVFQEIVPVPADVIPAGKLDVIPQPINAEQARQSEEWDRFGRTIGRLFFGEYTYDYKVVIFVDESGHVYDAQIQEANSGFGHKELIDACKQFQFTPGTLNGQPTKFFYNDRISMTVSFRPNYQPPVPESFD